MKISEPVPLSEVDSLTVEHSDLARLQYEALQKSSYVKMQQAEAAAYDQ